MVDVDSRAEGGGCAGLVKVGVFIYPIFRFHFGGVGNDMYFMASLCQRMCVPKTRPANAPLDGRPLANEAESQCSRCLSTLAGTAASDAVATAPALGNQPSQIRRLQQPKLGVTVVEWVLGTARYSMLKE